MSTDRARRLLPWILAGLVGSLLGALPMLSYRYGTHAKT